MVEVGGEFEAVVAEDGGGGAADGEGDGEGGAIGVDAVVSPVAEAGAGDAKELGRLEFADEDRGGPVGAGGVEDAEPGVGVEGGEGVEDAGVHGVSHPEGWRGAGGDFRNPMRRGR